MALCVRLWQNKGAESFSKSELLWGGMGLYNRYEDQSKFIMDMEQLCIAEDGYVYISKEEDYGIAIDMES